ncbi:MAG: NAD-glutamate dehydrogenase, partial [Pseudomonadales bacterium]|nr:NAD-glutamate dehydrogenase [Pseudomonadales bacterium]
LLVQLFKTRFDPHRFSSSKKRRDGEATCEANILAALDKVDNLNDDQLFRAYLELINATLRSNYFQCDEHGEFKAYMAFKISPTAVSAMPLPKPMFEIFVYAPWVEGVHLRGGKVARGGLRWSDRIEDFRTEVLGLVKAQQVKNSVIVPVGAKGGFVAKCIPKNASRDVLQKEGIRCYKTFICALLDITDNLVEGKVQPPENVVRRDEDDTYLVVAADKGTATFSDIANAISNDYNFWLGDAFASGGSIGYDHKKMGITAKGAWVSVQRLFREKGINVQTTDFNVIGIGDMSGDVFGNGMLLSEHICLQAAFNHLHIFIDPKPNPGKSFKERQRLFDLPRSSWADYEASLISKGGGIFKRSAKVIDISAQMKKTFLINEDRLTPSQLISALLCAPVDLLWNGGIGTYVKATSESHADVGDKANDILRVDANKLRCKVIGEGGNLGITQLARVEYALHGGASNTDFIDNAAGVDCSDHEVNIKILLNEVVCAGDMTEKQRRKILEEMTENVSSLVLANNYRQTQAISIAESEVKKRMGEYRNLIHGLEKRGRLRRKLEFMPSDETLDERKAQGKGLMRPELSVLISYVKGELKEALVDSAIPDDANIAKAVETAFPSILCQRYKSQVYQHRLRREIIATQVANEMVNLMGITFTERLLQSLGNDFASITKAFITARDVFCLEDIWQSIEALDHKVPAQLQMEMMSDVMRLGRRATRWFVRNRRAGNESEQKNSLFTVSAEVIQKKLGDFLHGEARKQWQRKLKRLQGAGVPDGLAHTIAGSTHLYASLGIAEAAGKASAKVEDVACIYFSIGEKLQLDWVNQQISTMNIENHWQALARESFRDDVEWQQSSLTGSVLPFVSNNEGIKQAIDDWLHCQGELLHRWYTMIAEIQQAQTQEFAMFSVAIRELLDLAQNSHHCNTQRQKKQKIEKKTSAEDLSSMHPAAMPKNTVNRHGQSGSA